MSFELRHPDRLELEKTRKHWEDNPHNFTPIVAGSVQCALCHLREHNPVHVARAIQAEATEDEKDKSWPGRL